MSDIFISYARSTAAQAQQVAEALRALGYAVWRDDELPAHRSYGEVIEERLKLAKAVVVMWSADAVKSQWVQSEADRARAEGKLVQLTLDDTRLPMPFDRIQCADLASWNGDLDAVGWRKVAASVAELIAGRRSASDTVARASPAPRKLSICVLPFVNMSGDAEQEYFSDGISEDVITDLSKVSALFVVARNTAFQFKGKSIDLRKVARDLEVSHVLEGSVRKAGGRVRINAQLIDGATGGHVWAERYDRDLTDIFALQDDISEAIVGALKLKLLPEEKQAIERRGTDSVDAYNLYLMARRYWVSGNAGDPRREDAVLRLCRRAIDLDPNYGRAWALTALAQHSLRYHRGRAGDTGLAAAERALALDASLAEPHAVKASNLAAAGRRAEASTELDIALALDPDSDAVNIAAAMFHMDIRDFAGAIDYFAKAVAVAETDFGCAGMLISCYLAVGDKEGARRAAQITLSRCEKVLAQDQSNGAAMGFLAGALAVLGEVERCRGWMDRALLLDPDNALTRYNFACSLSSQLGDLDGAVEMLDPVFANISPGLLNAARSDPDLDPLRGDSRFQAMLAAAEAREAAE
ncbi:MAG TPA: TIR domain-containing protein [Caulobacteraceae bacterium]|nr:TIR domain-containing protein [Caulobacteraceae bacterium]